MTIITTQGSALPLLVVGVVGFVAGCILTLFVERPRD